VGEVKGATTSMTSIPKPLKFLHPHFKSLQGFFEALGLCPLRQRLADFLSVLSMALAEPGKTWSLDYLL